MWRLTPGLVLHGRTWDREEFVLYNNLSGDTHLLDGAAMEVLSLLQEQPATLDGLMSALQLDGGLDDAALLTELLQQLQRMSLVEPSAC